MIKTALVEAKQLLDFFIENADENDLDVDQVESVKHFIMALHCGCACDYYHGHNCGCGKRSFWRSEALKELDIVYPSHKLKTTPEESK